MTVTLTGATLRNHTGGAVHVAEIGVATGPLTDGPKPDSTYGPESLLDAVPGVVEAESDQITLHLPDKTGLVDLGVPSVIDRKPHKVGCLDALRSRVVCDVQTPVVEVDVLLLGEIVPLLLGEQPKRPRRTRSGQQKYGQG